MSVIKALQAQEGRDQLTQEIGNFMFDALNMPLPAELQEKFQYPLCPFCKGRPSLVQVKGAEISIKIRDGSPLVITVPKYRVETCCSATYRVKHEGLSRSQVRRITARVKHVPTRR